VPPESHSFFSQHALKSHHERGTSSSPFDPRNIHNSHSHEVLSTTTYLFYHLRRVPPQLLSTQLFF
jgi:hypothetical protein